MQRCPVRLGALILLLSAVPGMAAQEGPEPSGEGNATAEVDQRFLHLTDNPLPPPMNGPWGTFLLEVVAYLVIAAILVLLVAPLLKKAASRIPGDLDNRIVAIIRRPGVIFLFVLGVQDSLRLLPLTGRPATVVDSVWTVVIILSGTYLLLKVWNEVILSVGHKVAKKTDGNLDDKLFPFFAKVGGVVIVVGAVFFVLEAFNVDLTIFAAGGAMVSLVLAFAAQDSIGNFFAGVFILLDQPFREGDRIEIREENTWGDVEEIGLRTTRIRTRDNRMVIVPNALIGSNAVINHSFPSTEYRIGVDVGIAYGTDVDQATEVMMEALKTVEGVNHSKRMEVLFRGFGDSALDFHVRAWFPHYMDARRYEDKLNRALNKALNEAGIEIPFPQRVVHMHGGAKSA